MGRITKSKEHFGILLKLGSNPTFSLVKLCSHANLHVLIMTCASVTCQFPVFLNKSNRNKQSEKASLQLAKQAKIRKDALFFVNKSIQANIFHPVNRYKNDILLLPTRTIKCEQSYRQNNKLASSKPCYFQLGDKPISLLAGNFDCNAGSLSCSDFCPDICIFDTAFDQYPEN